MSIITEHLGKLEGLVTLLRAVPYNASLRRVYLPQDIMMEQGVSTEQVVASLHASLSPEASLPTSRHHDGAGGLNRTGSSQPTRQPKASLPATGHHDGAGGINRTGSS